MYSACIMLVQLMLLDILNDNCEIFFENVQT